MPPTTKQTTLSSVDIVKRYPGPEQVELKVINEIPGAWFGGTSSGALNPSERREHYEAQAVEYAAVHEFKPPGGRGRAIKEETIRFICVSDAMDEASHTGFWMQLSVWNRYRHHTYKGRRDDELPFIKSRVDDVVEPAAAPPEKTKPVAKIRDHFTIVETGTHEQKNGELLPCAWYKCTRPQCKLKTTIKEVRKNTGLLYRHLKTCDPSLWRELRLGSKHSNLMQTEDGEIELWSFEESLPSHIRFVEHCFEDFEVFYKARSKSLKRWASTLNPRAGLPHRKTSIQILGIIRTLIEGKMQVVIDAHVTLYGAPCFGKQADIWSEKSMREAFFAARLSMQLEPQLVYTAGSTGLAKHAGSMLDIAPMIAFTQFTDSSHSGPVIARINRESLGKFRLATNHITLNTEDGAANNKKVAKINKTSFRVCFPHDMQRAILFSTGMTGSPCQNPELAAEIKKMSAMAAAPHRSVQTTQALVEAQEENGVKKSKALSTSTMNVTRWQGLYKMANKNRRLEKELKLALTGTEAGLDGIEEEPAEIDSSDEGDSSDEEDDEEKEEDEDEAQIQANGAANKNHPLAHRCLSSDGFKNGQLLESVLTYPNEVSCLTQKHEGMGLSMGYQMAKVLHESTTAARVSIVSGSSKEGDWKEVHGSTLPAMFKTQREIFGTQMDERFKVTSTPDKPTLLALAMDPSVDTTCEGIFSSRSAAQELLDGEYRRGLMRRALQISRKQKQASSPSKSKEGAPSSSALGKRPLSTPKAGSSKKGHTSVLALMSAKPKAESPKAPADDHDALLEAVKAEEIKYATICVSIQADPSAFEQKGIFDQGMFWVAHKQTLPIHFALWVSEVGCAKVASANIETVFSGAGRISNKSRKLSPEILSNYAFCHYNYKYDWLRPTLDEILKAYKKLYCKGGKLEESEEESADESSDEGSKEEESEKGEEEEDGEEGGE